MASNGRGSMASVTVRGKQGCRANTAMSHCMCFCALQDRDTTEDLADRWVAGSAGLNVVSMAGLDI